MSPSHSGLFRMHRRHLRLSRDQISGIFQRKLSDHSSLGDNKVIITQHYHVSSPITSPPTYNLDRAARTQMVDDLLQYTRSLMGTNTPQHLIAFSGGVDSSLVAALVHQSRQLDGNEQVMAVLGISPAVPAEQIDLAVRVAQQIGITLEQVPTTEGQDETYLANAGQACLACKTHLYATLQAIVQHSEAEHRAFALYNGTNADDRKDETRLGLIAAREFKVKSPLEYSTKAEVRMAARHLGLLNWNYAASPCLRSRLALGVTATAQHLELMAEAERLVRQRLSNVMDETTNLRVRLLAGNRARIEIDAPLVALTQADDWTSLQDLGKFSSVTVKAFQTGSVAKRKQNGEAMEEEELASVVG